MFEDVAPSAGSQDAERLSENCTDVLDSAQDERDDPRLDLLLLPGAGHYSAAMPRYWWDTIRRYFQEHLKP